MKNREYSIAVRALLRERTSELHEAVEVRLEERSCYKKSEGFALYLKAMLYCHRCFSDAERIIAEYCSFSLRSRELENAIGNDLTRLGFGLAEGEFVRAKTVSPDEAWGVQYALEGSAMGARSLKPVSVRFFPDGKASEYLSILADAGRERWPAFVEKLEQAEPDPGLAVQGAKGVFQAVLSKLD